MESSGAAPVDAPGGLIVGRHGRLGGRAARLALGALGAAADAAAGGRRRLRAARLGRAVDARALLELLGSHRGDAAGLRRRRARAARRGSWPPPAAPLAERARRDGVPVIPIPGGFQPRAAVGYSLVAALEAARLAGAAPSLRDEIEAAAALAETLAAEWGPDGAEDSEAKALARALLRHGAGDRRRRARGSPRRYRWKCQFNENAELPAFASALPEADHNEVVGWAAARELGRFSCVSSRTRRRAPAQRAAGGADGGSPRRRGGRPARLRRAGESRLERLVSLVLLGDLVSLYAGRPARRGSGRRSTPLDTPQGSARRR